MKETATCWIQKETHNRLKVFCALHSLSMVQATTQAVEEWLKQHASHLGNETLEYLNPPTDELGGFTFGLEYTPEADAAESVPGACSTKLLSVSLFL
jgi:hypothetical protein